MKENQGDFFAQIPFPIVAVCCRRVRQNINTSRTPIETAIMSAVAAGIGMYVTTQITTEAQSEQDEKKIDRIEDQVERIRSDLYIPRG